MMASRRLAIQKYIVTILVFVVVAHAINQSTYKKQLWCLIPTASNIVKDVCVSLYMLRSRRGCQ